jgi:hypothetical protein
MAEASITTKTIKSVNLSLTEEEAGVLYSVLERVGGDPLGPRGAIQNIYNELARCDIKRAGDIISSSNLNGRRGLCSSYINIQGDGQSVYQSLYLVDKWPL